MAFFGGLLLGDGEHDASVWLLASWYYEEGV